MKTQKTIAILSVVFASGFASAMPMIKATPFQNGSWVEVTQNGAPVANAIVNENFVTDQNGRVFINNHRQSSSVDYSVMTPDGGMAQTSVFIRYNKRR